MVLLLVGLVGTPLGLAARWATFRRRAAYHADREREYAERARSDWDTAEQILDGRPMHRSISLQRVGPAAPWPPAAPGPPTAPHFEALNPFYQRAILDAWQRAKVLSDQAAYHGRMRADYERRW
jgi:hypothetical protein